MATFEVLALVTDLAKQRTLHGLAHGECQQLTHFSVGNAGHDPIDPFNALTPDVSMQTPSDQVIFPPLPIDSVIEDDESELSPIYVMTIVPGLATGVLSSLYLWATVMNDATVEAELNANVPPYTAIDPPPPGFLPLNPLAGFPRFEDLPTVGNVFGDKRNVALTDLDYYWNGVTWRVVRDRFLYAIANMPRTIKFPTELTEFRAALQF